MSKLIRISLILILMTSCTDKRIKLSGDLVVKFIDAYSNDNHLSALEMYPEIRNYSKLSNYKVDSITIEDIILPHDSMKIDSINIPIEVVTKAYYKNNYGKLFIHDISFYVNENKENKLIITDSKGLFLINKNDFAYKLATLMGAKLSNNVKINSDRVLAEVYNDFSTVYDIYVDTQLSDIKTNIKVSDWYWESSDYNYSASGGGIITNGSSIPIKNIKYLIEYKSSNGKVITTETGYIHGILGSSSSRSFSFYTNYIGNASKASIRILTSRDMIDTYIDGMYEAFNSN